MMAPPCYSFPASELPDKVQETTEGKRRKMEAGVRRIDLSACEIFEMVQYKCEIRDPSVRNSAVQCFAVDRLFRRCKDRKGTFTVETTAWEGREHEHSNGPNSFAGDDSSRRPYQWSSSWRGADTPPS